MEIRSDINARTAMVYAGAAFLLVIVGFKSIVATIESWSDVGILTYLSIFALVLEFALLNSICSKHLQSWAKWRRI